MHHDKSGTTRRGVLQGAGALALGGAAAAAAQAPAVAQTSAAQEAARKAAMQEAIRQVVGEAKIPSGKVRLDIPPLVENGNTVPITVTVDSPMTAQDHVKAIAVFNEKNPQPNVFSVQPRAALPAAPTSRPASGCHDRRRSPPSPK